MSATITLPPTTQHTLAGLNELLQDFPAITVSLHHDDDGDPWASISTDTVTDESTLFISMVDDGLVLLDGRALTEIAGPFATPEEATKAVRRVLMTPVGLVAYRGH